MIDRIARDRMADALTSYMDEKIGALAFDNLLIDIAAETEYHTVHHIQKTLWVFYDDIYDHKVIATKEVWDYFNRLLLLLKSDGEWVTTHRRVWHFRQLIAAACLVWFGYYVVQTGVGSHLIAYAMPFGVVSMLLARFHSYQQKRTVKSDEVRLMPFQSFGVLRSTHRNVAGLRKRKFRSNLATRTIRSPAFDYLNRIVWGLDWLVCSPLVLLFQALPERQTNDSIQRAELPLSA